MEKIREYIIDTILSNIKDNIIVYSNMSDEYFKDIKSITEEIYKNGTYLNFFLESSDPLIILTDSTLTDLSRVPYIYDYRDGV